MTDFWIQAVSLVGAILILAAFVALQRGWSHSTSVGYLWANFLGSLILTVVAIRDRRMGFVLLEGVWAIVSLWSLMRPARPA